MKNNLFRGGVGIVLILVFSVLMLSGGNQKIFLPFDPDSPSADGTKAYFMLLQKMGYRTAVFKNYDDMGQVILTKPLANKKEGAAILNWVKKGNTLVSLNTSQDYITQELKLKFVDKSKLNDEYKKQVYKDEEIFSGVERIDTSLGRRFKKPLNDKVKILAEDHRGPWMLEASWGKGKIILLTESGLLTNGKIGKKDNVIFGVNLIKKSRVSSHIYFYSGFIQSWSGPVGSRFEKHWFLALVYILIFISLLFYYWGKRFGLPIPAPIGLASTEEYSSSLANLYRFVKGRRLILQILSNDYRQSVIRYMGLPVYIVKEEIRDQLQADLRPACQKAYKILVEIDDTLEHDDIGEHKLLKIAQDIELWRRENVENGSNL